MSSGIFIFSSFSNTQPACMETGIDKQMFLDANTEHVFIYAKLADFLPELRELFREPDYLIHLVNLVKTLPDFKAKMESRKRLIAMWNPPPVE